MKVLITGGGTGGHVVPGLAVAEALQTLDPNTEILFVGTKRGMESELVPRAGFVFKAVSASGLRGMGWGARIRFVGNLGVGLLQSLMLLLSWRPDVVIGTGGYVGVPVLLAARMLRKPLTVQEQNSVPGSANRLMARWATRIDLGFSGAAVYFPGQRTVHTGNPVRRALVEALTRQADRNWDSSRALRILIFGGSLGAATLNRTMIEAASQWVQRTDMEFHLQTGRQDHARVVSAFAEASSTGTASQTRIEPFIDDMPAALGWADLVVCRAGAMTLAELAVAGRPAILVPFPHATDDHQTMNASGFVDAGAALHLPDSSCNAEALTELLNELHASPVRLEEMGRACRSLSRPDAAMDVAVGLMRLSGELPDTPHGS